MLCVHFLIKGRAVLGASIRVMDEFLNASTSLQSHSKGLHHGVGVQTFMHVITDYFLEKTSVTKLK